MKFSASKYEYQVLMGVEVGYNLLIDIMAVPLTCSPRNFSKFVSQTRAEGLLLSFSSWYGYCEAISCF